jgi:hypothetical protein
MAGDPAAFFPVMRIFAPLRACLCGLLLGGLLLAAAAAGGVSAPPPSPAPPPNHEPRVRFIARIINVGGSALRLKLKKTLATAPGFKLDHYPGVFFRGEGVPEPAHILENGAEISAFALKYGMTIQVSAFAFKTPTGYLYRATRIIVLKK